MNALIEVSKYIGKNIFSKSSKKILTKSILTLIMYYVGVVLIIGSLSEYKMCSELGLRIVFAILFVSCYFHLAYIILPPVLKIYVKKLEEKGIQPIDEIGVRIINWFMSL